MGGGLSVRALPPNVAGPVKRRRTPDAWAVAPTRWATTRVAARQDSYAGGHAEHGPPWVTVT